jgi:hypothetical protein
VSKQDANAGEIVSALRAAGAVVRFIEFAHGIAGCPDILVGHGGTTWLLELKVKGGRLNDRQKAFHAEWVGRGGPLAVVRTIPEAFVAIGLDPPF